MAGFYDIFDATTNKKKKKKNQDNLIPTKVDVSNKTNATKNTSANVETKSSANMSPLKSTNTNTSPLKKVEATPKKTSQVIIHSRDEYEPSTPSRPTLMTPGEITSKSNIKKQQESIQKGRELAAQKPQTNENFFGTVGNALKIFGQGAMKAEEGMFIDMPLGISAATGDIATKILSKGVGLFSDSAANRILEFGSNYTNKLNSIAAQDWTANALDFYGWNKKLANGKTVAETMEDSSIIKESNLGGKVVEGIGGMTPSILMGGAATEIAGLTTNGAATGGTLAAAKIKSLQSAVSYSSLGARSYGGAYEEAINNGGTIQQANAYGLLNAATEIGTEWMSGGVPGLKGTAGTGLDGLFEKYVLKEGLEETSKSLGKAIVKGLYKKGMEGVEEMVSEFISPFIKQFTYQYDENGTLKDNFKNAVNNLSLTDIIQAGIVGSFTSFFLDGVNFNDMRAGIQNQAQLSNTIAETINQQENMLGRQLTAEEAADVKNKITEAAKKAGELTPKQTAFTFDEREARKVKSDKQNVIADDVVKYKLNDEKSNHDLVNLGLAIQGKNDTHQIHIITSEGFYEMGMIKKDANGNYVSLDGSEYIPRGVTTIGNEVYINADVGTQSGTQAMYHELFESFKNSAPSEYKTLKQMVTNIVGEKTINAEVDDYYNRYKDYYKESFKNMTDEQIRNEMRDEIINDKFGELAEDEKFINKICDDRNIFEKFIDSIKDMIRYVKGTEQERQLIKLKKNLETEFAKRYKTTDFSKVKNKGRDTAFSLGKHYGDLGKGNDTYYGHMYDSRRSTGHFGTGTYFVGEDYQPGQFSSYANRPVQTVEFNDYNNLFKPVNKNDGFDLHDGLKEVNYNNKPISKQLYDKLLPYYEASFNSYNELLDEDYDNDYKNVRKLLKDAGVETEEPQNYYDSGKGQYGKTYEKYLEDEITEVLNNYDRYQKAERDLKRVLGITDEQFNKAIEKVRQTEKEYESHSYDQKLKDDSLSTVFMKTLGYNGVDVRGLEGLDDTTYGSVIYDLDNKTNNAAVSLTTNKDNTGRTLTKEQREFFKNSKAVDENGNLQVVYHGTTHPGFNVFKASQGDSQFGKYKFGDVDVNYFTASKDTARGYTEIGIEENGNIYETYLNITNPYTVENTSNAVVKSWKTIKDNNIRQYETDYYNDFEYKWNREKSIKANLDQINEDLFPFNAELRLNEGYYELYDLGKNDGLGENLILYVSEDATTNELFDEGIKEGMYGESFDDYYYTSDRIAKWVLTQNANGAEYDGIIIPDIVDNGTKGSMFGEPTTDYIAFNSNQIKRVDNTSPTLNEDIRFSLAPTGEMVDNEGNKVEFEVSEVDTELPIRDENKLMVLHNLGEGKMNGIMDLDGIPVPSLAVTNPYKVDHSGFGEATLIFKKDTINPENRLNEVYDRDVWSPTQPQIDYDIKFDDLMDLEDKIYNKHDAIAGTALNRYFDRENLSDNVDRYGIEGTIEEAKNSDELKYIYYKTMNPDFEILRKIDTEDLSSRYSNELLQEFNTQYGKEIPNWMDISDEQRNEVINDFRNYWQPILEQRANEIIAEENAKPEPKNFIINMAKSSIESNLEWLDSYGGQDKLIEHLHEIQNNGGNREINDIDGTKEFVNNNINQEEYNKWVDDTLGNLLRNAEKGIYNGKDYITNNGRRTFKQLHDKYTLENLVKALTKGDTKGTQKTLVSGYGQIQAQFANRFNSIEDIRNAQNQIMSDEQAKALTEEIHNAINEDIDALADRLDGDYFNMSNASELILEYAKKKTRNEEVFRKLAKDYANHGIPSELIQKITNDLEALKDMPTDYFEAKPQRAVGLDEIGMALIPNTWSEETKQRMKDKGIKFIEYDKSIEGERQRLEKDLTDYMFSLTSNKNIESKEIAPVKTMEETIAPIREDISNISKQMNDLSEQIKTLQNQPETTSDNDIAPYNPYRARAIAEREANQAIEEMQKDENYWKQIDELAAQTSDLDEKSARKMSRNIGKELGLKQKQIKDLQNVIQKAFDGGYSLQDIKNELDMQFGHTTVTERNEGAIEAQKLIRQFPIKVSQNIQKDIADYGYWKQGYFGKINFSNKGEAVDVVYAQLNELDSAMFPSDIINPTDQLMRIAEVADMQKKYSVDYEMSPEIIDEAANYIHDTFMETLFSNAMRQQTDLEEQAMQYNERTKDIPIKKKTRQEVRENLQNTMGITTEDLQAGNDIKSFSYQTTTPERVNEKVFGREVGRKINEQTVFFAKHQEAERIRFLNKERAEIADLGIKARSKESALVQQYGEGLLDDVQLAQAVSDVATQEKIKKAARILRAKYDTYLDQINEELVEMGYDAIPKRKDYMRHFQELSDKFSQAGIPFNRQDLNAENLPTDINGLTEFNVPGKNWFASAQRRTGDKTTFDAITGIDGYLEGASNLMYHTETIQRYRALEKLIRDTYGQTHGLDVFGDDLSSEQAMQRIQDIQEGKLSNYAAWLKEQGNALAGKKATIDRGIERALGRRGYTLLNTLKKQVGSNMTGFNVRSALTNFISSTIAASKTNKIAMVKGTVDTIRNIFHDDGFINKSDFLTSRFGSDALSQKTWQKISNAGQILMTGSDWFTSNVITRSKYYEGTQKGMTESQAMAYANDFAARVMGDRSKGATAEVFNSKTLGLLTQFQLETNNQWQYMIHDTKMEYQENLAKEGGLKAGATVLFQIGQLAAYSYLFNELFEKLTGSRAAFDIADIFKKIFGLDDDDKDKDLETRMQEAASELMDALPFTSLFGSGGRLPIGEMLTPAQTLYDYITGGTNKYGQEITLKDVGKDIKETIPYYVLPTGYGQIKKTAQGLGMYANEVPGSYTDSGNLRFTADEDTGSMIKNALFGQWADTEAKKYRESGYQTIRANDIPLMRDLGMTSSEFREFKQNMKDETSTSMDVDGTTYNKYFDANGNMYWYDKDNRTVYDADMNKTDISIMSLEKANASELKYDYVSNLPVSEDNKMKIFDELFTNTTTDKYGYKKFTDSKNKTYWYDEDNDILYNSKYNKVNKTSVDGLSEVSESRNMANYKDYGSYAEFDYAMKNPAKYKTMKAIAGYDNYQKYKSELTTIRDNTKEDKKETFKYINSLDLTIPQKAMFLRQYYSTYKKYNKEIVNYVANLDMDYEDKVEILESLKFKVDKNGNVTWK